MSYPSGPRDLRRDARVSSELPVTISIGTQFSVQGHLKDLSQKSAFIRIRHSMFLQTNDDVGFSIQLSPTDVNEVIQGMARVSRIVPGEGFAVYFLKLDDASMTHLRKLV